VPEGGGEFRAVQHPELRSQRAWSQEGLTEEAGIHRTYLGGIETARRNPSLRNINRIAGPLGVPARELFQE
jgi:transcriptional regulator with XRE-family HTH domain